MAQDNTQVWVDLVYYTDAKWGLRFSVDLANALALYPDATIIAWTDQSTYIPGQDWIPPAQRT